MNKQERFNQSCCLGRLQEAQEIYTEGEIDIYEGFMNAQSNKQWHILLWLDELQNEFKATDGMYKLSDYQIQHISKLISEQPDLKTKLFPE